MRINNAQLPLTLDFLTDCSSHHSLGCLNVQYMRILSFPNTLSFEQTDEQFASLHTARHSSCMASASRRICMRLSASIHHERCLARATDGEAVSFVSCIFRTTCLLYRFLATRIPRVKMHLHDGKEAQVFHSHVIVSVCSVTRTWLLIRSVAHAAARFGSRIYMVGGSSAAYHTKQLEKTTLRSDVWFTEDGAVWTEILEEAPFRRRYGHSLTAFYDAHDTRTWLVLIGGFTPAPSNDIWMTLDGGKRVEPSNTL